MKSPVLVLGSGWDKPHTAALLPVARVAWSGWVPEPMGLFDALTWAQVPSSEDADLRTATHANAAKHYPQSQGPTLEGR